MPENKQFTAENVRLIFRNFAGAEGQYNQKGDRNFAIILTPEVAEHLLNDGWNVKFLKNQLDEGEVPTAYLPVAVSYKYRPPRVVMKTATSRTFLNEDQVEVLDYADISTADVIINGSVWTAPGNKGGIKAYLKTLVAVIEEDELERKHGLNDHMGEPG